MRNQTEIERERRWSKKVTIGEFALYNMIVMIYINTHCSRDHIIWGFVHFATITEKNVESLQVKHLIYLYAIGRESWS